MMMDWVNFEEVFADYENGHPLKCYQKANSKVNLYSSAASGEIVLLERKGYIKLFRRSPLWQEEAISNKDDGSEGCTL